MLVPSQPVDVPGVLVGRVLVPQGPGHAAAHRLVLHVRSAYVVMSGTDIEAIGLQLISKSAYFVEESVEVGEEPVAEVEGVAGGGGDGVAEHGRVLVDRKFDVPHRTISWAAYVGSSGRQILGTCPNHCTE